MLDEHSSFTSKIIYYSFGLLFFLTPLFWFPINFELFEFNKMLLVYALTVVIVSTWFLKSINQKLLTINHTPLDIPLLLFLGANILSTIFSIDQHTSIWGYYSRSNGGLLSLVSYLLLYWAFVSNISKAQVFKLLKIGLGSGFIISLWGILEHFGVSASCVILRGEFNASCWVQDVQSRVFATLGQPNWLAAYLAMLIFPALYFLLTTRDKRSHYTFYILLSTFYLAFTFTYSRGGTAGLLVGLIILLSLIYKKKLISLWRGMRRKRKSRFFAFSEQSDFENQKIRLSDQTIKILGIFLLINLLFGSALTRFNLSQVFPSFTSEVRTRLNPAHTSEVGSSVTQLESGGTESGKIRLIVWEGALDIFKHYPIFGSGVETFAYSYYQFRPAAHNLVSEWDFLYNKAHNEFLNYLANTGLLGFSTYIMIIITFIKYIIIKQKTLTTNYQLLTTSLLASYISYLVGNFFGFSVVITALFFFLFPALAFVATDSVRQFPISNFKFPISNLIFRRTRTSKVIVIFVICYLTFDILKIWYSDTLFAKGERASETGSPGEAYNYLTQASSLRKDEPFYLSEFGVAAASLALAYKEEDATLSGQLKTQAQQATEQVLKKSPNNTSFWRTAIRAYYDLSLIDPSYNLKLLSAFEKAQKLAPTDPKILYNKAVVLGNLDKNDEAIEALNQAIKLKPNYREAYLALGLFYFDEKKYPEAVSSMRAVLRLVPNDAEALSALNDWGEL